MGYQIFFLFPESWYFYIYKQQLVLEYFSCCFIYQLYFAQESFLCILKTEGKDTHRIDGFQVVIPLITFLGLLLYREGGIKDAAVFEVLLWHVLQFDDELVAFLVFTIQIKDGFSVALGLTLLFTVQVGQILDLFSVTKHLIKKVNEQIFVVFATEQFFEPKISKGVDVSLLTPYIKDNHLIIVSIPSA